MQTVPGLGEHAGTRSIRWRATGDKVASGRRHRAERCGAADCWSVILGAGLAPRGPSGQDGLRPMLLSISFLTINSASFWRSTSLLTSPHRGEPISAKKTAMFFQIDRRLGLMVELTLSSEIPFLWSNRDFGPQISRAARLRKTQSLQTHKESFQRAACRQKKSTKASNL